MPLKVLTFQAWSWTTLKIACSFSSMMIRSLMKSCNVIFFNSTEATVTNCFKVNSVLFWYWMRSFSEFVNILFDCRVNALTFWLFLSSRYRITKWNSNNFSVQRACLRVKVRFVWKYFNSQWFVNMMIEMTNSSSSSRQFSNAFRMIKSSLSYIS